MGHLKKNNPKNLCLFKQVAYGSLERGIDITEKQYACLECFPDGREPCYSEPVTSDKLVKIMQLAEAEDLRVACENARVLDFAIRIGISDFELTDLHKGRLVQDGSIPMSSSDEETVVMQGDEVVLGITRDSYDSVYDRVDNGEDIAELSRSCVGLRHTLTRTF